MPSKIQVDQIAGATGSTVTLPSGQTLDLSSGTVNLPSASLSALNASNLTSGTVPSARLSLTSSDLPTVPTTKGGTGLTTIGTANQVLRVNSGATALEFGTISSGANAGEVIQVLSATDSTTRNSTSTTFVTASNTLSVTITPSSASNKIFVSVSGNIYNAVNNKYTIATIFRGATDLGASSDKGLTNVYTGDSDTGVSMCMTILDSPNTTSATTYQVYFRTNTSGHAYLNEDSCKSSITVFEIKG